MPVDLYTLNLSKRFNVRDFKYIYCNFTTNGFLMECILVKCNYICGGIQLL